MSEQTNECTVDLTEPTAWLNDNEADNSGWTDDGHVLLVRDHADSGDPAVFISKEMLAGPELLRCLRLFVWAVGDLRVGDASSEMCTAWRESNRVLEKLKRGESL